MAQQYVDLIAIYIKKTHIHVYFVILPKVCVFPKTVLAGMVFVSPPAPVWAAAGIRTTVVRMMNTRVRPATIKRGGGRAMAPRSTCTYCLASCAPLVPANITAKPVLSVSRRPRPSSYHSMQSRLHDFLTRGQTRGQTQGTCTNGSWINLGCTKLHVYLQKRPA